jgi:hypothetical protein
MRTRNRRAAPWLAASAETTFGPCETFTTDDATTIAPQNDWQFSHIFEPVTQGRGHRL